jgi:glyoxylase-like metal-dependent hydrolase (beta-lactamase superfamily II)
MSLQSHRFRVGSFECISSSDGFYVEQANKLFINAPEDELQQVLQANNIQPNNISSPLTCLIIKTGEYHILVDTGLGSVVMPTAGKLLYNLQSEGISPEDIDIVIISHCHPDHIGGITDKTGNLIFPNARYMMGKNEWDFWTSAENLSQLNPFVAMAAKNNLPLIKDKVELIDTETEILPGLKAISIPGHTLGHIALEISSEGEKFSYLADLALHAIHLEHPEWYTVYDSNPQQIIDTRHKLLEKVASEQALTLFYHFDFPSLGYVIPKGNTWQWQPV